MKTPPTQKPTQTDYVKTALRMPSGLRDEMKKAAEHNGRSLNAEIIARLQVMPLDELKRQNQEILKLLRQLLDRT